MTLKLMNLKKGKILCAIVFSILSLSSCKSLKNTNTLFQSEYDKFADTAKSVYVANGSTNLTDSSSFIKPLDLVAVKNLQNREGIGGAASTEGVQNATIFRVNKDGFVTLPVIGQVKISGLTQSQAASKVQEVYSKSLLKNPIIELTLVNYKVTLLGEIMQPGNYQLDRENVDLIELLGKSGGLTTAADPEKIKIIRGNLKHPEIIYINLKNIEALASDKLILQKNDIIYIAPRGVYNISENIKNFSGLAQPAFIILNAVLLIYTISR